MKDWAGRVSGKDLNDGLNSMLNPDRYRSGIQRGSGPISTQDNRKTEITIQGVPGNPAVVGRAAEEGVRRGYGASGSWAPHIQRLT